ncbi:hypothetical protein SANTM175S_03846 [Streptomyces antimycoticus]
MEPLNSDYQYWCAECARALIIRGDPIETFRELEGEPIYDELLDGAHAEAFLFVRDGVNFRLRDWLFSRQRYWGEPFPIVYDEEGVAHALPESMLPLKLPEVEDYSPRTFRPDDSNTLPETPLSRNEDWVNVVLDLGDGRGPRPFRRETNTMPNWAGSCWYELRYLDPHNSERLVDPETERYWMGPREGQPHGGVDLYVGGSEHAVLHLLYARFWSRCCSTWGMSPRSSRSTSCTTRA